MIPAPLKHAGLLPRLSNDLLGVGCVWSQPAVTPQPVFQQKEYVLETLYTLQLTPMMKIQPDQPPADTDAAEGP